MNLINKDVKSWKLDTLPERIDPWVDRVAEAICFTAVASVLGLLIAMTIMGVRIEIF